ncbi:gamma carbonic anhydrase family protein [Agromyces subbeticus]|uniref:gamma carbonic anhydrase family protein n=1 Tax=Agromyces subbeticus TaxID=293890 RepID=UPI0003B61C51|nr:gamma carbonic anhydrase family protein [Agromyces subbeticus]
MLIEHRGHRPVVHPTATIAATAVLSGDVTVGAGSRILHGAVLSAEDGAIRIGAECVVMEHALLRGRAGHDVVIGDHVMIGPHSHVNGATLADEVFIATGASVFPGASIGHGAEVRINAVVQVNTVLGAGTVVPISWVAVGAPATVLPPERHDEIWAIQRDLDFVGTVYGSPRAHGMHEIMTRQSAFFAAHSDDRVVDDAEASDA